MSTVVIVTVSWAHTCVAVLREELHLQVLSVVLGQNDRRGQLGVAGVTAHIGAAEHQRQRLAHIARLNVNAQRLRRENTSAVMSRHENPQRIMGTCVEHVCVCQ